MFESNQVLFGQCIDELNSKKRVTGGLFVDKFRQRRGALRLTMQGVFNQMCQVAGAERRQTDLLDRPPARRIADSFRVSGCAGSTSLSR